MKSVITPVNTEMAMTFAEAMQGQVYYWTNSAPLTIRSQFTHNYYDLRMKNDTTIMYLYKPDIQKLVDLSVLRCEMSKKQQAVDTIWRRLNPLVQLLQGTQFTTLGTKLTSNGRDQVYKTLRDIGVRFMNQGIAKSTGGIVSDKRNKRQSRVWALVQKGENKKSKCSC